MKPKPPSCIIRSDITSNAILKPSTVYTWSTDVQTAKPSNPLLIARLIWLPAFLKHREFVILKVAVLTAALGLFLLTACQPETSHQNQNQTQPMDSLDQTSVDSSQNLKPLDTLTLGAGCFWCVEAVFEQIKGVYDVRSGYMGGQVAQPSYREVCTGRTGHAEVVQFSYDPSAIPLENLLEIFFGTHDPTTLNRQGEDVGTQYRSVIFYRGEEQQKAALQFIERLNADNTFKNPVVTEVAEAGVFYVAENYHQEYFRLHGEEPYCKLVVRPKVEKFQKAYARFRR